MIHRIAVDFDIEATSHFDAVNKVQDWICPEDQDLPDGTVDLLVLEENKNICPCCRRIQNNEA